MLKTEKLEAKKLGYDRPSNKLVRFLEKNFNLVEYIPQNNNFVVYNDYFENTEFNIKVVNPKDNEKNNPNDFYRNISYGFFANNQATDRNTSYNCGSKNVKAGGQSVRPPWASSNISDNFVSSSSSYGAYYAFDNKNTKKYY
jgi:hypothetical protein